MKNKKKINLKLDEVGVKHFTTTPTFYRTLHESQRKQLKEGDNIFIVGHVAFNMISRVVNYIPTHAELIEIV